MVLTLVVGGATRLTESGLSIVEWKPVTGVLPPLSQDAWQAEFAKYQQIPQYRELNRGMSLDEFKTIYWWEWSHRLLARLVGAAFLLPFLFFLWRGWIEPGCKARLWTLFGAGALLGAVGWWMVSSGLAGRVSVSQYRLAFHLTLACAIYAAILWTARGLGAASGRASAARGCALTALGLAILVLLQIYLGALVAGLDAGLVYNTWPQIDGALIPSAERLWFETPVVAQSVREHADGAVQSPHGGLCALDRGGAARSSTSSARGAAARCSTARWRSPALVTLQAGIGIVTLLHQAPLPLALLHQVTGIVVLTIAVIHAERLSPRHAAAAARAVRRRRFHSARNAMIELSHRGGIAVVTMAHGKANALDIELLRGASPRSSRRCARAGAKAVVLTGQGADVLRRRRSASG